MNGNSGVIAFYISPTYYGGPIGNHQRSFERYHLRPPMASPSSRLGVFNLATPLSEEHVKLRTSNLAGTFKGSI